MEAVVWKRFAWHSMTYIYLFKPLRSYKCIGLEQKNIQSTLFMLPPLCTSTDVTMHEFQYLFSPSRM
jgi:hypothetical protein